MLGDTTNFRRLRTGTSVHEVADRCRDAAFELLSGASASWGRAELDAWLAGAYQRAAGYTAKGRASATTRRSRGAREVGVEATILETRRQLLDSVRDCTTFAGLTALAREMVESGCVVGVRDGVGSIGYAPVDHPDMPLRDRVAALVATDYLIRPNDYRDLVLCDVCGELSFSWAPVHRGDCADSIPASSGPELVPPRKDDRRS